MERSGEPQIPIPWAKFPNLNRVERFSAHWIRFNKIDVFKIWFVLNAFIGILLGLEKYALKPSTGF